jgi:nucleotide-binding universal stress UspA family protein
MNALMSAATMSNIRQRLFFAFIPSLICVAYPRERGPREPGDLSRPDPPEATRSSTEIANFARAKVIINVIVAYARKAASHYADASRELVALSIELANQSFRNSKLRHVGLQLVHAYQTDYEEEGQHFDHLCSPDAVMTAYVDKRWPDLVVAGTRGRSATQQALIGSVTEGLLKSSPCDVLAVPAKLDSVI